MQHEMKLKEVYFEKIKSGEKTYEIRLNDEKRKRIGAGDVIMFKKEPELTETLTAEVKDLVYFDSFDETVNALPIEKIGFAGFSKEKVKEVYRGIYGTDEERTYGVVAIELSLKPCLPNNK